MWRGQVLPALLPPGCTRAVSNVRATLTPLHYSAIAISAPARIESSIQPRLFL